MTILKSLTMRALPGVTREMVGVPLKLGMLNERMSSLELTNSKSPIGVGSKPFSLLGNANSAWARPTECRKATPFTSTPICGEK